MSKERETFVRAYKSPYTSTQEALDRLNAIRCFIADELWEIIEPFAEAIEALDDRKIATAVMHIEAAKHEAIVLADELKIPLKDWEE